MKRVLFLLLAAFGLLFLSACASAPTDATQAAPAPTQYATAQSTAATASDCLTLGAQTDGSICTATCSGGRIVRVTDETSCTPWTLSATATPEPWPAREVVRTDDLGGGNFVNWFEEPSYSAVFLMAPAMAISDGPLPIGEAVIGGLLFYVWYQTVGQDALMAAGAEIANGIDGLRLRILAKAAESDPYLIQMDPSIPIATEGEMVATDWNSWPPAWMSIRHPESPALIAGAIMRADTSRNLNERNRQGCESRGITSGAVCIYAAYTLPATPGYFEGHVAILVGSSRYVYFLVLNGTFRNTMPGVGEGNWIRIQDNVYYDKTTLFWKCAWWMADRELMGNGHDKIVPQKFWLDAGSAWDSWQVTKQRYGFVVPIASVPLPPNPFG